MKRICSLPFLLLFLLLIGVSLPVFAEETATETTETSTTETTSSQEVVASTTSTSDVTSTSSASTTTSSSQIEPTLPSTSENQTPSKVEGVEEETLYRLYHPGLKVHLFTKSTNEYSVLGG
ncbi:TPA: hypothetical protein TXL57_002130 [Streptococcus suis]|nr:hypothetical protein [Streptococcus suis]HEL1641152.1 hypothetical protein [Streptococcus suis]